MRLTLDEIEALSLRALVAAGARESQAAPVARSVRAAEAEGTRGVGLGFLPIYCRHVEIGKVDGAAEPSVSRPFPASVAVDARCGFAHTAYEAGEEALIEAAQTQGVAALGVTNSCANGVLGYFVDRLARRGLVGFCVTSGSGLMAPWGGRKPFFSTNPFAFAAPRADGEPLVLDSSASATAYVNIVNAAAAGEPIPDHWALDAEGRPTTDPAAALDGGTVAPAGGHKGFVVALMVEIMAAGLSGARWSHEASSLGGDEGGPPRIGQTYLAFRPDLFAADALSARVAALIAAMTEEEGVRAPGDRRIAERARSVEEGVEVDEATLAALSAWTG